MVDRLPSFHRRLHRYSAKKCISWATILAAFIILSIRSRYPGQFFVELRISTTWGGQKWIEYVLMSAKPRKETGHSIVLVNSVVGFVGFHVSTALKLRRDGTVGLDNFNNYYDPLLKKAHERKLNNIGIFVVEGDINDSNLLKRLFKIVEFTHVMHLAVQAGVRYGLKNPTSYIHRNVAGFVAILEACKSANPQPAIIWASSSLVYGLNSKTPFSETDKTDQPASLYAVLDINFAVSN